MMRRQPMMHRQPAINARPLEPTPRTGGRHLRLQRPLTGALAALAAVASAALLGGCPTSKPPAGPAWSTANPVQPLPTPPLGAADHVDFSELAWKVTPEKVRLGRLLFFDGRLSVDGTVSCATCHDPRFGFSEKTPVSTGVRGQKGGRKAPPVVNAAFQISSLMFWDGRAASLAEQAKGPIENPIEMGSTHEAAVATVAKIDGYRTLFKDAFQDDEVTIDRLAEAIASYEATLLSGSSPWDRYKAGEQSAISEQAKQGETLFFGKADCSRCHIGWTFSDWQFHNLGVGWDQQAKKLKDEGRFAVTKKEKEKGAFKTPTLRDTAKHAPYMHDGSVATLRDVVEHYNRGGTANPWLSPILKKRGPLGLSEAEIDALVAFMEALTGEGNEETPPTIFP